MKLNYQSPALGIQLSPLSFTSPSPSGFKPSTWVKLRQLPNPFSYDEALLLCQYSEEEWLAWIPDHGEMVLHQQQFCQC